MLARTEPIAKQARPLTGRHVLAILIAFFSVVFAVNGVFLYQALSSYTGVVSSEPYRKGLQYNDRIAAERAQDALGWRDGLALDRSGHVTLELRDGAGQPVRGLNVTAIVGRPSTAASDRRLTLAEVAAGTYTAGAPAFDDGAWLVNVEASGAATGTANIYRLRKRVWLTPQTR